MNPDEPENVVIDETPVEETSLSVSLSADAESVPEGGEGETTQVVFFVDFNQLLEENARIIYNLSSDNSVGNGSIDIIAGEQSTIITNEITGDAIAEEDETLNATISEAFLLTEDGEAGEPITISQGTASTIIADDDGEGAATPPEETPTDDTLSLSISADANVIPEGAEGETTTITYTVDTGQALDRDARVIIESTGGSNPLANEPLDILAGEQTATFTNEITGDDEAEPSEILTGTVAFAAFNTETGETGELISIGDKNTAKVVVSDDDGGNDIIYRFFNPTAGVHFYTDDENERSVVQDTLDNYTFEGASYRTVDPITGDEAGDISDVYRFFNSSTGVHLYTTDERERDFIQENNPAFSFEGTAFSAYETQVEGSIPVYRFYEPTIGVHFYTPNEPEKENVENNLPNYDSEGIAYYALPLDGADV